MIADSIKFKGHRCFKNNWAGFERFEFINVIIGRNNVGKSHLIEFVSALCDGSVLKKGWSIQCMGTLDEDTLRRVFNSGTSGGELNGNHWDCHGRAILGQRVYWEIDDKGIVGALEFSEGFNVNSPFGDRSTKKRIENVRNVLTQPESHLADSTFRHLLPERELSPEPATNEQSLSSNGHGGTNIIRRHCVTSDEKFPRELVQVKLLYYLNEIFGTDGQFLEIVPRFHDVPMNGRVQNSWEIYLMEEKKGLVPLSNSGSGIKTILLVLINLFMIPEIEGKEKSEYVFAFEELENNLHPALLRRLFTFIESYAIEHKVRIFLTTHSSVALDVFGVSENAQIIHVTHDGESAKTTTVSAHFDKLGVVSELGAKPSDILQSNGIIWVEGPSDRVYLSRWISVASEGKLREGRDFQCAFYGGALLARTQACDPAIADDELVNLIEINPNLIVVCDSDKKTDESELKERVEKIQKGVKELPEDRAMTWVFEAREIENYIPGAVLGEAFKMSELPDPGKNQSFFAKKNSSSSYIQKHLGRRQIDKMELAAKCAPLMTREVMESRFDWKDQMARIVKLIEKWNG